MQIKYFSIIFIMLKYSSCFLLANINNINNNVKQQVGNADNSSFKVSLMLQLHPFHAIWSYPNICSVD